MRKFSLDSSWNRFKITEKEPQRDNKTILYKILVCKDDIMPIKAMRIVWFWQNISKYVKKMLRVFGNFDEKHENMSEKRDESILILKKSIVSKKCCESTM